MRHISSTSILALLLLAVLLIGPAKVEGFEFPSLKSVVAKVNECIHGKPTDAIAQVDKPAAINKSVPADNVPALPPGKSILIN